MSGGGPPVVVPPLLSDSPPPPPTTAEDDEEEEKEEDDEFGDFIGGSREDGFDCFESTNGSSCQVSPQKYEIPKDIDINSNLEEDTLTVLDIDSETSEDFLESRLVNDHPLSNSHIKCDPDVDLENSKNEINSLSNVNIPYLSVVSMEDNDLKESHSIIDALKSESEMNAEQEQFKSETFNSYKQKEEGDNQEIKCSQEDTVYECDSVKCNKSNGTLEGVKGSQDVTPEFDSFETYEPDDGIGPFIGVDDMRKEEEAKDEKDDFADFTGFTAREEDFGEFASSSDLFEKSEERITSEEEAYEMAKRMFEIAFPPLLTTCEECQIEEIEKGSELFDMLKDITDTPAFAMQWTKSSSQKLLLKALSIDERNILPSWTSSTPIFASNLSLRPLEPVKTEPRNPLEGEPHLAMDLDEKKSKEPKLENMDLSIFDVPSATVEGRTVKQESLYNNTYATWLDTFAMEENRSEFTKPDDQKSTNEEEFTKKVVIVEEDEFTDFQSSLPEKGPPPLVETLLTPVPVYQNRSVPPSTLINWPDPGITDEDVRKLEEAFSKSKDEVEIFAQEKQVTREEEWSEFISAVDDPTKSSLSPLHKLSRSAEERKKERTSSPDLPLSVFNLGSIQPARQPIPVITSRGLLVHQTKLSANATKCPQNVGSRIIGRGQQQQQQQQRAAISSISKQYLISEPPPPPPPPAASQQRAYVQDGDDDEWGEFVSSNTLPLDPATLNSYRRQQQQQVGNGNNNVRYHHHRTVTSEGGKSVMMGDTLPELDFIAPKSRTTSGRKK